MPYDSAIVMAAWPLFLRFGYRKLSMTEIAKAAGISRPTLYATFAGKEAVFRACVAALIDDIRRTTEERLDDLEGLETRLTTLLEVWLLDPASALLASPEGMALVEETARIAPREVEASYGELTTLVERELRRARADLPAALVTSLALVVVMTCRGAKDVLDDDDVLRPALRAVVELVCMRVEAHPLPVRTP